jgi:ABC-type antimicrobial peptide transport system permease subunit
MSILDMSGLDVAGHETVGSAALGRALNSLVYGVSVRDPAIYAAVSLLLIVMALVSCLVSGIRASRVDPMIALRLE